MLVDGGSFAMHILHSGTDYFVDGVFKNPVNGVGSLPLSRVLAAARREQRCQNVYLPSMSCEIIECPALGHRLKNRPVDGEKR